MRALFLIKQLKRLLSLWAKAPIRQGLNLDDKTEMPDNILIEFELATDELVQAAENYLRTRARLRSSEEERDQSVSNCQQAASQVATKLEQATVAGVPLDEFLIQS